MNALDITKKAHRQLEKLPKTDNAAIREALKVLKKWPNCDGVKYIVNSKPRQYRLRIGDYRAFFTVNGDTITITEVKKRNERTY